ncbi:nuclear transport factor 2 family protein [Microbacterium rhizomatis]|uniref:Nuclear transport factor 2 family protein n=1 Tax=Microbacterium rhizomatis TaxID=1631477 RepID=A0A5J5J0R1_9MICO|nr:nuclear transport factor 2 family protein [Microbacterium rhizomatis]KAA9107927.1 nuclear transport factor 2 family protein [Microbacterium rhizomatis]
MTSVTELLAINLFEVFGNRDAPSRQAAIERTYSEDVVFTDPEGSVRGRAALEEKAAAILDEAPTDFVFTEDGERYAASDVGALAWAFGPAGAPVVRGMDVITVEDGRITSIRTFFIDDSTVRPPSS